MMTVPTGPELQRGDRVRLYPCPAIPHCSEGVALVVARFPGLRVYGHRVLHAWLVDVNGTKSVRWVSVDDIDRELCGIQEPCQPLKTGSNK